MRLTIRTSTTGLLAAALLAGSPVARADGPPSGTTRLGQTSVAPTNMCGDGVTLVQARSGPGQPAYDVAADGVITSFSYRATENAGQVRLVLFGAPAGTRYPVAATSAFVPFLASTLNTFAVRVPVRSGWLLGASFSGPSFMGCSVPTNPGDAVGAVTSGSVTPGSTVTTIQGANALLGVSAVVEPDADRDGFGDVSQDLCPVSALAQAACPPPDTSITKAPGARSSKRKVALTFASSIPGSTFLVSVDGTAATASGPTFTRKLAYGKHTVSVQAVSPLGPVDPSPATTAFTIKKKRKR